MALDAAGERIAADRAAARQRTVDELKTYVGAATAVPMGAREGRASAAGMERVVGRGALAGTLLARVGMGSERKP